MSTALDIAKIFIKRGLDTDKNTFDGNMKIQKLLFFADVVSLADKGKPLFNDPILAFKNGCVVESVRLRYKNDYAGIYNDSCAFNPDLSQDEYEAVNLTSEIFGKLSARELSELNHSFDFWRNAFERSKNERSFKDKDLSIISIDEMTSEIPKIKKIIEEYRANASNCAFKETINGVTFFYSPELKMSDDIMEQLETFSMEAEESSYSVYQDNGNLVIY